jgi:hypothetical protein
MVYVVYILPFPVVKAVLVALSLFAEKRDPVDRQCDYHDAATAKDEP